MGQRLNRWIRQITAAVLALATTTAALADPPGRVGRVGVHGGHVMIAPAGGDWRTVSHNYPVTHGDNLYVTPEGRAEIDFGSAIAWLAGGTVVFFDRIDDHHLRVRLSEGQMVLRVRELDRGETARVDMRRGQVEIVAPGLYRFEVNSAVTRDGHDLVHVKMGRAELSVGSAFEPLRGGDAVEFDGYRIGFLNIRGEDAFGAWADARDRRYESQRYAYVSPYMIGARDLDDHGIWREHATYGWVWFPRRVAADWAPYRFGHWTYVAPWGWTWVDDAPWGFAPFHYGRWVHLNGRWGWCPGPWVRRPVYSPALVAWHGPIGSAAVSVSLGSNALVYWTPLSWGEVYYPSYTVSVNFWRVINRPFVPHLHVEHYHDHPRPPRHYEYRNWRAPGGATAVEASVIANARPVAPSVRAMGPLPTTQQVEAMSIYDRVKPLYEGAPVRVSAGMSEVKSAPRSAPVAPAAVGRTMPPSDPSLRTPDVLNDVPPGRVPAPQPQGTIREAAIPTQPAPAPMPAPGRAAPQPTIPAQTALAPTPSPPVPTVPTVREPPMVAPAPAAPMPPPEPRPLPPQAIPTQPAPSTGPVVRQPTGTAHDARRVSATSNRGEAPPARPVQPFVEPMIRAPRAVAPQPAPPDRSRRLEERDKAPRN